MKKILILLFALGLVVAGCSSSSNSSSDRNKNKDRDNDNNNSETSNDEVSSSDFGSLEMQLESLGSFQATFTMTFEGDSSWEYTVVTRSDGAAMEYSQHITGLSAAKNPGDIRLVHAAGTNQMSSEAFAGQCMQFPDSFESGIKFLTPTDLINTASFSDAPEADAEEEIAGQQTQSYTLSEENVTGWQSAEIVFWLDEVTEAVMDYELNLVGEDPFFGAGEGTIIGTFIVDEVGPQEIDPVTECAIDFPMPDDAGAFFQLPGLIVYETSEGVADLGLYYHEALLEADWLRRTLPQEGKDGQLIISYVSDTIWVDIKIEPLEGGGSKVEMYVNDR